MTVSGDGSLGGIGAFFSAATALAWASTTAAAARRSVRRTQRVISQVDSTMTAPPGKVSMGPTTRNMRWALVLGAQAFYFGLQGGGGGLGGIGAFFLGGDGVGLGFGDGGDGVGLGFSDGGGGAALGTPHPAGH